MINLIPPNLARLGVRRHGDGKSADLTTPWITPYPMHSHYLRLCQLCPFLTPYGKGTRKHQGLRIPGYITSGYRDCPEPAGSDNWYSPHMFAFAWDILITDAEQQIEAATKAITHELFTRVGLYPDRGFIHVDMAPQNWIERYGKALFWVQLNGEYRYFRSLNEAIEAARRTAVT